MISRIFEENQVMRLFENMPLTTPKITENIMYSDNWNQDSTESDNLPNYCTPHDKKNVLQSVKNEVEDDNQLDIIKEEDVWCKDLEYGCLGCGNEKDEMPTQKVNLVKSESEVDDPLHIVKEEETWCKDLEFVSVGYLKKEIDETPIDNVDECDSGSQYTVRGDTEISQDYEVGSLLTNPVKESNKRKIKSKVQSNQNNLNGHQFNRKNNLNKCAKKQTGKGTFSKFCNNQNNYENSLGKHMVMHTREKLFACTLCNKQFTYKSNYKRHMILHSGEKPFKCELCDYKSTRKSHIDLHMNTHVRSEQNSIEKPHKCTLCDKKFFWRPSLSRHMLKHSAAVDSGTQSTVSCDTNISQDHNVCFLSTNPVKQSNKRKIMSKVQSKQNNSNGYQFNRKNNVDKRTEKQADNGTFACTFCNKQYNCKYSLRKHMLIHQREKAYKCELCDKQFHWKSRLRAHMIYHASEKPFACTLCDKQFKDKYIYKKHMFAHNDEKPIVCTLCKKQFKDKYIYKRHMLIHSDEKPFKCELCDNEYKHKSLLTAHMWTHSSKKPYKCTLCDKEFIWKTTYTRHMLKHSAGAQSTVSCDTDIPQDHKDCSLSAFPINQSNACEIMDSVQINQNNLDGD